MYVFLIVHTCSLVQNLYLSISNEETSNTANSSKCKRKMKLFFIVATD